MSDLPLISIITVVYNGADHLEETIQSVLGQSYPYVEYIVIDGGSTDGSVEIIQNYDAQISYWVSETDNGIYHAMNKGLTQASGDLVNFLNADDYLMPESLQHVSSAYGDEDADVYYGNQLFLWEINGERLEKRCIPNLQLMEKKMGLFHQACFVRRNVFEELGKFDESFSIAGDYEFMLRVFLSQCRFTHVNAYISAFRLGGASASYKRYLEGYRIQKRYHLPYGRLVLSSMVKMSVKKYIRDIVLKPLGVDEALTERRKALWRKSSDQELVIT